MRIILSVALALTLLPFSAEAQIEKETSEVTNTTRLESTDMRPLITESYPGHASFRAKYERTPSDSSFQLSFYGFADQSTDMSVATQVRMQVDGQPVAVQEVQSETRSMDGSILEIKHVSFRRTDYEQIATGDRVVALIGPLRFELTRPLREDLRLILDRVPERKGPPTAVTDESGSRR